MTPTVITNPASEVNQSILTTDITYSTSANVANQQPVNSASVEQVTLAIADLDDFRNWQADKRNRRIAEKGKSYGADFGSRRNTLVLRRANCKEIAPDADVLAYLMIYAMKDPLTAEGKKVSVTDAEIKAYLALDYEFTSPPTLVAVTAKAQELGGSLVDIAEDEQ